MLFETMGAIDMACKLKVTNVIDATSSEADNKSVNDFLTWHMSEFGGLTMCLSGFVM